MTRSIETTGRTEDDAIAAALAQLGLTRDDVSVTVLERARSGFFGIGASPAKVRVTYEVPDEKPAPAPAAPAPKAAPKAASKPAPTDPPKAAPRAAAPQVAIPGVWRTRAARISTPKPPLPPRSLLPLRPRR